MERKTGKVGEPCNNLFMENVLLLLYLKLYNFVYQDVLVRRVGVNEASMEHISVSE